MQYLNRQRIVTNMWTVVYCLTNQVSSADSLKSDFMNAINRVQHSSIRVQPQNIYFDFENDDLFSELVSRSVFGPKSVPSSGYTYAPSERELIRTNLSRSLDLIRNLDPNLEALVNQVVSSIACFRCLDREGGTMSNFVGLIHLSPNSDWTISHFAENIVHETIHNCLFIEDMVHTIFPSPGEMEAEDALVISAIRHTPRPIDKSFHSACVAAILMYFHHLRGDFSQEDSYLLPLRLTVEGLITKDDQLRQQGRIYLSENGRYILRQLQIFCDTRDYELMVGALRA